MTRPLEDGAKASDGHLVVFYEKDRFLVDCIAAHVEQGLAAGADVLVVATPSHRRALRGVLGADKSAAERGGLTSLDARETLVGLLTDGDLDDDRLYDRVAPWLASSVSAGREPRIYGEMVALLWDDGRFEQALQLESLWNRLGESYQFRLLCGYPLYGFGDATSTAGFVDVCQQHTAVATESYSRLVRADGDPAPMVVLGRGAPGGRIHAG